MPGTFKVGRVLGIEISLHWSWAFIFALVTWNFADGVISDSFPDWDTTIRWAAGVVVALLFFCSLLLHELSHSIVAQRLGIKVRGITLFIFGGSSNLESDPETARQEALMAVVGPLASFALAVAFSLGYVALDSAGSGFADVSLDLGVINLALGIFNLMPGFPMDGGRLLRSLFWARDRNVLDATRLAAGVGEGLAVVFMAIGVLTLILVDTFAGLWLLLIGNFLRTSSIASFEQVYLDRVISKVPVTAVWREDVATISPAETVDEIVEQYFLSGRGRCLPVVAGTQLLGLVTLSDVRKVPREDWATTSAFRAMTPAAILRTVGPTDSLAAVLELMAEHGLNQIPVVEGKLLRGMIERSDVIQYIQTSQALTSGRPQAPKQAVASGGSR